MGSWGEEGNVEIRNSGKLQILRIPYNPAKPSIVQSEISAYFAPVMRQASRKLESRESRLARYESV